ncbi:MAG: hypothetical protein AMJ79_15935, partial [Phycisphaerae bacterium SM23_30]
MAGCHGTIVNCLISNNAADSVGAVNNCDGNIINCTIVSNRANADGVLNNCDGAVVNCIIWGNRPATPYDCTASFGYCCLEWVDAGAGNINADPNFAFEDDYHIISGSPCIDAGDNTVVPFGLVVDLEGNSRFLNDPCTLDTGNGSAPIVDMGAYEHTLIPWIFYWKKEYEFFGVAGGNKSEEQKILIRNRSGGTLNWQISERCSWLLADPCEGSSEGEIDEVKLKVDPTGLTRGIYDSEMVISDSYAVNSPQILPIRLCVYHELYIPAEYETIQAAIDDANDYDRIIVADGVYQGHGNRDIDFKGKSITVRSENGPEVCIIDCEGDESDPHRGFRFHRGENNYATLDGFTITNGWGPGESLNDDVISAGGAIFCEGSSPTITNCIIIGNSGHYFAGGILCTSNSSPTISNCIISHNTSYLWGGGIYIRHDCNPNIINCMIINNRAVYGGGVGCTNRSKPRIINCTICNNVGYFGGGGFCSAIESNPQINNSILWGNTSRIGNEISLVEWGKDQKTSFSISYSDIRGGKEAVDVDYNCKLNWGVGNIDTYPHFAFDNDYHIRGGSPCIDAGDNLAVPAGVARDIEGIGRFYDDPCMVDTGISGVLGKAVVDMGAYEYVPEKRMAVFPIRLEFFADQDGPKPQDQTLSIDSAGAGSLQWLISENCSWLKVTPMKGRSNGEPVIATLKVDTSGLIHGDYNSELKISDPCAINSPQTVQVKLYIGKKLYVTSPYLTIQAAIDAADEGDTIIVADGTYTGDGNRDITFRGKAITVRSENGPGNCIVDCEGSEGDRHNGFLFKNFEDNNSLLSGFTIINGYAYFSGGIYCGKYSSMEISNCIIRGNTSIEGGGIYIYISNPTIINCTIEGNETGNFNVANYFLGGGIRCIYSNPIIINSNIIRNKSQDYGGGLYCSQSELTIINCIICDNTAAVGGGMYVRCWSKPKVINCTFSGNSAVNGKILAFDSLWQHCPSNIIVTNGILWDGDDEIWNNDNSKIMITYSDVQGGWPGEGNINIDPNFVDEAGGDYHLRSAAGRWDPNQMVWV